MDLDSFFAEINENSWKRNTSYEATIVVDKLIDSLIENKEKLVEMTVDYIDRIEHVKLEESEQFGYTQFQKWLSHFSKQSINEFMEDENGIK